MTKGKSNKETLTWSRIREISREANSLSAPLPDMGRCTKTQTAQVDSIMLTSGVQCSSGATPETDHQATAGENSFPSLSFSE